MASGSGTRTRRKSSVTVMGRDRKLSQDVTRKLSAISTAPDISALSDRLGLDQDHLKTIVKDILDMDDNNKWQVCLRFLWMGIGQPLMFTDDNINLI